MTTLDDIYTTRSWAPPIPLAPKTIVPSLEMVIDDQGGFPPYALLMGMCDDNLPLVLDLTDPSPGAFLIASDSGFDNSALIHSLISSALTINSPQHVTAHLISPHANDLLYFRQQPGFKISYEPFKLECEILLEEMVNLVLDRQKTRQVTPVQVFSIDGLDLLWQAINPKSRMRLDWLIEHGPSAGLWIFASIESTYIGRSMTPTLELFPSRILGPVSQPNLARYLTGLDRGYLAELEPGRQFFVRTLGQSFKVWLLRSEEMTT